MFKIREVMVAGTARFFNFKFYFLLLFHVISHSADSGSLSWPEANSAFVLSLERNREGGKLEKDGCWKARQASVPGLDILSHYCVTSYTMSM